MTFTSKDLRRIAPMMDTIANAAVAKGGPQFGTVNVIAEYDDARILGEIVSAPGQTTFTVAEK